MTYEQAWNLTQRNSLAQAIAEGWEDEWEIADEHIRLADYDYSAGIIDCITEYDE
jgi:hypothetical protein